LISNNILELIRNKTFIDIYISTMEWWIYLLVAIAIIFTIMLWNANNDKRYQRLRRARAMWNDSELRDRAEQRIQQLRGGIGDLWDRAEDVFDDYY